jgi:aspartate/methionine/tyrosine aminotransferase
MFGIPALNAAIAGWWRECTGVEVDPDREVSVTSGCTEAIAAAMLGLVNPGDEVILFEPYYDSYRAAVAMAGGIARCVTLRVPEGSSVETGRGFWFDPDELRRAFTARTRAILVNTPHNPTGKVFGRGELGLIAELCVASNAVALTDEVYERLTYEPSLPHVRLAMLPGMAERTVTMSSLGKTFGLTGWKVGWAVAPPELTRAVRAAHQFLTFATATPLQHGAAAALGMVEERERYVGELLTRFGWGREFLGTALTGFGFKVFMPAGAYFIMADWTTAGRTRPGQYADDAAFCKALTAEAGVAAIPPGAFYEHREHGQGLARFAFCKRQETLEEAVRRLERWAGG